MLRQMALGEGMYQLVAELLRFIVPPADSAQRPGSAGSTGADPQGKLYGPKSHARPDSRGSQQGALREGTQQVAAELPSQQTAPSFWFGGWFRNSTPLEIQHQSSGEGAVTLSASSFVSFLLQSSCFSLCFLLKARKKTNLCQQ